MSVINTNVSSLIAQNAMKSNSLAQSKAMQQLSTGLRINSASDDAAGLAIASKMTSQIRGLDQAVRNGNDGISMLQTAEGAMVEMTNMMQRMRELSVQSANDSNTADDRTNLNAEFGQLKTEITRIAANTQWNGMNILNGNDNLGTVSGNNQTVKFQVGSNANQTIDIDFKDFTFTPGATSSTATTAQINFAGKTAGTDAARFKATFGGVAVDITLASAGSANTSAADVTALAADLQTKMRAYSGLEGVTITSNGETLSISEPTGKALSGVGFFKADGTTAATMTGMTTAGADDLTISNGTAGNGAAPAGGVFSAALAGSSIATGTTANTATGLLDTALAAISTERSKIGATVNRLAYAVSNLANVSQNTSESRSRVQDTDYAKTSTELARTQIIAQASTAMLAQANQSQQSVLALLK